MTTESRSVPVKADPVLASIYEEPLTAPVDKNGAPQSTEEKKQDFLESNEGKLKLFLGGLYFQTEQDIRDYFKKIAPILQLTLITDKSNTGSKGYAFLTLEDKDGTVRKKVLSTSHYIKGKIVDLKLEDTNKKVTDQLSANKKIFVGGLDPAIDASELRKYFEKFGGVQDAIVIRNVSTNVSRGFGFVTFDSEEVADKCVKENNYKIKGKRVDIKKADPRQTRPRQPRVYPLPGSEDQMVPRSYYPPPYPWPYPGPGTAGAEAYPGFAYPPPPEALKDGAVMPPQYPPWAFMPPMPGYPIEEGIKADKESAAPSKKRVDGESEVGPMKTYKSKSKNYAPY